jgi:hypothetical protein
VCHTRRGDCAYHVVRLSMGKYSLLSDSDSNKLGERYGINSVINSIYVDMVGY